jgi:hypothetical protein
MNLHRSFSNAQVAGDLLVEPASNYLKQDRVFARCQHFKAQAERVQAFIVRTTRAVAHQTNIYRIQKILLAKRLGL